MNVSECYIVYGTIHVESSLLTGRIGFTVSADWREHESGCWEGKTLLEPRARKNPLRLIEMVERPSPSAHHVLQP